jgi:hypothetical protein
MDWLQGNAPFLQSNGDKHESVSPDFWELAHHFEGEFI